MTDRPVRALFATSIAAVLAVGWSAGAPSARADDRPGYAAALRRAVVLDDADAGAQRFTVEQRLRHYGVPGVSVAVVDGCRVVHARGYGRATPDGSPVQPRTLFQAGSVSKVVAAAGVLTLVDAGVVSLDDPVPLRPVPGASPAPGATLPTVPRNTAGDGADRGITLRRLLSHGAGLSVAGFKGYEPGAPLPTLAQILDGAPPANTAPVHVEVAPGSTWRYSGGGFVLVQQRLEHATGESFAALMHARVLAPAGMRDSTYTQPLDAARAVRAAHGTLADGTPMPGGWRVYPEQAAAGLWSTPTDLARFAIALAGSLRGDAGALLAKASADEMLRRQNGAWGLGVELSPDGEPRRASHTGAPVGYRTLWMVFPDTCQGAAIMTNADEGMPVAYEIARALADAYDWPDPMASEIVPAVPTTDAIATRFVGTYRLRDFPSERFDVGRRADGTLTWSRHGRGHRDLVAVRDDELVSPDSGMRLDVLDDDSASGTATTLELVFPGGANIAERVTADGEVDVRPAKRT